MNIKQFEIVKTIYETVYFAYNDNLVLPNYDLKKIAIIFMRKQIILAKRVKIYTFYVVVIELFKVFNGPEEHSINRHINNVTKSATQRKINQNLITLQAKINSKEVKDKINKIINLRNKYVGHWDSNFNEDIILENDDVKELLNILEEFLQIFSIKLDLHEYQSPQYDLGEKNKGGLEYFRLRN